MATRAKKQPETRKLFLTDQQTHADVTAYAESQKKDIKVVLSELIYSSPRMQRFLSKNTQSDPSPVAQS